MKNQNSAIQALLFHFVVRVGVKMVSVFFVCTALVTNRS